MKKHMIWLAVGALFLGASAFAQNKYPERPITIVVERAGLLGTSHSLSQDHCRVTLQS
jgi:hypothetical protein